MNVLHKTARATMKRNSVRTGVTILGIILSAALFTAVTTFCSSIANYLWKTYSYEYGTSHVKAKWMDEETYERICEDSRVESVWSLGSLGYAKIENTKGTLPYLLVVTADANPLEEGSFCLLEGRLPKDATEVMVPAALIEQEGKSFEIGNELTLELGLRTGEEGDVKWFVNTIFDSATGEVLGETLESIDQKVYLTITGVYDAGNYKTSDGSMGYRLITGQKGVTEKIAVRDIFIKIKNPAKNLLNFCQDHFEEDYKSYQWRYIINEEILMFSGYFQYNNIGITILWIAILMLVVIIVGSVMLIYSVFSISIGERTRQFGLFSSIGASKKQLRAMVRYEAFVIATIGTPIGIVLGISGMWLTLSLIGDKFKAFQDSIYDLTLHVSVWAIAAAIFLSYLTIFISAWIPSVRAGRVSAIEAIRQNQDIRVGKRKIKISKLFIKIFGTEAALARKYYGRDRRKYRTTVLSLMVSIVMVISVGSLNLYIDRTFQANFMGLHEYDVSALCPYAMTNEIMEEISQLSSVEKAAFLVQNSGSIFPDEEIKADYNQMTDFHYLTEVYMDDLSYKKMLQEQGIWELMQQRKEDEYPGVLLNMESYFEYGVDENGNPTRVMKEGQFLKEDAVKDDVIEINSWKKTTDFIYQSFSQKELSEIRRYDLAVNDNGEQVIRYTFVSAEDGSEYYRDFEPEKLKIGAMITTRPFGVDWYTSSAEMRVIYPLSQLKTANVSGNFYMKAPNSTEAIEDVNQVMKKYGYTLSILTDYQQEEKTARDAITVVKIFSWGFLVLITLVGIANVFNTVTSNIMLRRRDFAMLSSIGMEVRQRNRMLRFECLTFVCKALLFSVIPTGGILWVIKRIFGNVQETQIIVSWSIISGVLIGIVVVVFLSLAYAVGKMKKEELLETLRREAI